MIKLAPIERAVTISLRYKEKTPEEIAAGIRHVKRHDLDWLFYILRHLSCLGMVHHRDGKYGLTKEYSALLEEYQ